MCTLLRKEKVSLPIDAMKRMTREVISHKCSEVYRMREFYQTRSPTKWVIMERILH